MRIGARVAAAWVLLGLAIAWSDAIAQPAAAVADCLAPGSRQVLQPATASAAVGARGIWLDAATLRWPGKPRAARYRLHHAARGGLVATRGQPLRGGDGAIALALVDALPAELAGRFGWVAIGVDLRVAASDLARLDVWQRGQLLLVQEDAAGNVLDATATQLAARLDQRHAAAESADDLGVRVGGGSTRVALWAPTAQSVSLCVFAAGDGGGASWHALRRDDRSGVWRGALAGELRGKYYAYLVDVYVPDTGLVRNRVTDPYSISLGADSRRSWIGSLDDPALAPKGWDADRAPPRMLANTDLAIYELHVRDFSIGDASVPGADRGKYLGFAHPGSDGMRHLYSLADAGITDVHLLPVFDLATVPEIGCVTPAPTGAPDGETQQATVAAVKESDCFNWGYDPWHYTAPEGSYASDARDGAVRIREFRRMVMALHRAGLRVGMDVVYNHTSASGQHEKSVLDRIVPGYYHRLNADGAVERSTCCDNTATEHRMMAKLMRDSVVTWARDHHVDSFRFDLMGHQPRDAMLQLQREVDAAAGRRVHLIGEGWNFGEIANGARFVQAAQGRLDGTGIATFSDRARDAARGGGCCDSGIELQRRQGWLNGLHYAPNAASAGLARRDELMRAADLVRVGLSGSLREFPLDAWNGQRVTLQRIDYAGQPAGYASEPGEVVNYIENHDNPTLFDINALKLPPDTSAADRARVQILGAALVAFSQGVAYFHAGMDTLRSKSMDRNSFDSGDWFNRLDWTYRDNFFGTGLPPAEDNGVNWPLLRPLLANAAIRPTPEDIAWTRDAFRDLLRIRASSVLFRLRRADEVIARLRFPNSGAAQQPTVVVGQLNGRELDDAKFREVMYFINVDPRAQTLTLASERDKPWVLHPVQAAPQSADARARESRFDPDSGRFEIPARTAVVYVVP